MSHKRVTLHLAIWLGVFAFWLSATRQYHPTPILAVSATAVLVSACALAVYINGLLLSPGFARRPLWRRYAAAMTTEWAAKFLGKRARRQPSEVWLRPPPNDSSQRTAGELTFRRSSSSLLARRR